MGGSAKKYSEGRMPQNTFFNWLFQRLKLYKLHKNKGESSTPDYGIGSTNYIDF